MRDTEPQRTGSSTSEQYSPAALLGELSRCFALRAAPSAAEARDSLWELVSIEGRGFGYQAVLIFRLTPGDIKELLLRSLPTKAARRRRAARWQMGSLQSESQ